MKIPNIKFLKLLGVLFLIVVIPLILVLGSQQQNNRPDAQETTTEPTVETTHSASSGQAASPSAEVTTTQIPTNSTTSQPTTTAAPSLVPPTAALQSASGETAIVVKLKNEKGEPVSVTSGTIFVSNQSGSDSDNMNLAGAVTQQCFTKTSAPGEYKCVKYSDSWFAGMGSAGAPSGYCIIDGGRRQDEGESPLPLSAGEIATVDVILKQGSCTGSIGGINPPTNPAYVPDCSNVQGPTTVRVGQSVTYLAQFSGPENTRLLGTINAVKTTNTSPNEANSWEWNETDANSPSKNFPPKEVTGSSGSLSYTWQPQSAGVYQVFCRAWNSTNGNIECRGALNTVDGPPRYACTGQGAVLTVNVTSADISTTATGTDMCQMAMTIGGNVLSPQGTVNNPNNPLTLAAIPKPGFTIKQYTFAFYNQDNNPTDPKPIQFELGKQFVINSPGNNISLRYEDLSKPDLNFGGKIPTNIQVNAYFSDEAGRVSSKSPSCTAYIKIVNPTHTPVAPTLAQEFSPSPETNKTGLLATVGVLIIAVIVSLNFFFS